MEYGMVDVVQGYGSVQVLDSVTFELARGITSLLGPNGAGKSTLMRTLVTETLPKDGHVVLGGILVRSRRERRQVRADLGYLPQNFGYDGRFTVHEHVEYMAWLRGVPVSSRSAAVREAIYHVSLDAFRGRRMRSLSGGSRQRAGIAGAIVGNPGLLVLDEPTVGLDPSQRAAFRRILVGLPAERVLLSTHLTDDVESIGGNMVLLNHGEIRRQDSVQNYIREYGTVERGYLKEVDGDEGGGEASVPNSSS